jgi:hypothetical protein
MNNLKKLSRAEMKNVTGGTRSTCDYGYEMVCCSYEIPYSTPNGTQYYQQEICQCSQSVGPGCYISYN